jgi:hemerythrin
MGLIAWNAKLETGNPRIDEQHKALIAAFNDLHGAMKAGKGKEEVGKTLVFLKDYTVTHFKMEEDLMARSAYPALARHKAIHADLLGQVGEHVRKFQEGSALTMTVMNFLEDWLMVHIQGEDMKLAAHLKGKA